MSGVTTVKQQGGGGAFITQKGEKIIEVKKEIAELEQLLQGAKQTSQSTLLLKKRKEMREVDEALELMKKDYKKRMDECEERRLQFEQKQAKMRDQVLKFEKFIQENDNKRIRADAKAKQEKKLYEEKCKEIQSLQEKMAQSEISQKDLLTELSKRSCYRLYLELIVEENDQEYEEIANILIRHKTLTDSNKDLMTYAGNLEKKLDKVRYDLQMFQTENQNQLLVSNSYYQQSQKRFEDIKVAVSKEGVLKNKDEDKKKDVSRQFSQVINTLRNICSRCTNTMKNKTLITGHSVYLVDELNDALDIICLRLVDLIEISSEFNEKDILESFLIDASGSESTHNVSIAHNSTSHIL